MQERNPELLLAFNGNRSLNCSLKFPSLGQLSNEWAEAEGG